MFHIGAFFQYSGGKHDLLYDGSRIRTGDVNSIGTGLSAKLGGHIGRRAFLAAALGLGAAYDKWAEPVAWGNAVGMFFAARLSFDIFLLRVRGLRIGLHASAGVFMKLFMKSENTFGVPLTFYYWSYDKDLFVVRPVVLVGISLGG